MVKSGLANITFKIKQHIAGLFKWGGIGLTHTKNSVVAHDFAVGLLINFGASNLYYKICLI